MGKHARRRSPAPSGRVLRRLLLPLITGVVVFGTVTAFAASLSVTSKSLGSGNATVSSCNGAAAVSYTTAYSATLPGYKVATAPVTTAVGCALMGYRVTLTGAGNTSLGEVSGSLDVTGAASPDFSASNISAALVTGVSVSITG
jgi:zona occludens toxin (predicted ATPase)